MEKKLYVCLTYYHTLVTLVKALVNKEQITICINNNIDNFKDLYHRLENSGCFEEVIEYDGRSIKSEWLKSEKKRFSKLSEKKTIKNSIEKFLPLDLREYELYLYHDYSSLGRYCVQEKIPYHLIEDALDYFKYFDEYYNVPEKNYKKGSLKFWIKDYLGLGYRLWGSSPYCIDIEVNEINGIKISNEKVFELSRKQLFGSLTYEQKVFVYNTYASGKNVGASKGKTILLCTQPLYEANHVPSMESQLKVFEAVIRKFHDDGYHIVIKPHPRDNADYTLLIEKYQCGIIDKNLPSEILNYNPDARYEAAVSITSTAINFLDYAEKKVFMGMDYVNEVLKSE